MLPVRVDTKPEDDVVDDDEGKEGSHCDGERTGDTKEGDENQHKETPHYQITGEEPDERKKKFVHHIMYTIEKAYIGPNHTQVENDVNKSKREIDLEKSPHIGIFNLRYIPCFDVEIFNPAARDQRQRKRRSLFLICGNMVGYLTPILVHLGDRAHHGQHCEYIADIPHGTAADLLHCCSTEHRVVCKHLVLIPTHFVLCGGGQRGSSLQQSKILEDFHKMT